MLPLFLLSCLNQPLFGTRVPSFSLILSLSSSLLDSTSLFLTYPVHFNLSFGLEFSLFLLSCLNHPSFWTRPPSFSIILSISTFLWDSCSLFFSYPVFIILSIGLDLSLFPLSCHFNLPFGNSHRLGNVNLVTNRYYW
jgi:hypothetical protein